MRTPLATRKRPSNKAWSQESQWISRLRIQLACLGISEFRIPKGVTKKWMVSQSLECPFLVLSLCPRVVGVVSVVGVGGAVRRGVRPQTMAGKHSVRVLRHGSGEYAAGEHLFRSLVKRQSPRTRLR